MGARQACGAQQTSLCYCPCLVLKARLYKRMWGGTSRRSLSPVLNMPSAGGLVCALGCKLWKSITISSIVSREEMANLLHRGVWPWRQMCSNFVWKTGDKNRSTISGFVFWRRSFSSHFLLLLLVVSFTHLPLVVSVLPFMSSSLRSPFLALLVHWQTGLPGTAPLPLHTPCPAAAADLLQRQHQQQFL